MIERERIIREDVVSTPQHTSVASVEHRTTVVPSEAEQRLARIRRVRQVIYFVASAFAVIIMLRFALLLMAANPANAFASFIYGLSGILVAPFNTLFGDPVFGSSVFEISSLIAIAVYYLLAWGIVKVYTLTYAPPDPTGAAYQ